MSDEEKLSRKMMIILVAGGIILLIGASIIAFMNSPKYYKPEFISKIEESTPEDIFVPDPEFEGTAFPIEINTASSDLLQLIPNIGPTTAELIIDYRNSKGTILDFDELLLVDGIGEKTVEILKEYCIIN